MRRTLLIALCLCSAPATAQTVKAGIEAWGRGDYAAAISAWGPLAAKGDPDAMFDMGQAYRLGRGVPIDLARAQDWYDRAARTGHVDAQTQLGMLLFQGGNRAAGVRWLKSAADKGEPRAQLLYGTALFNGDGIVRDPMAAYRYVTKSAAQGLPPAQTTLAELDKAMPADQRQKALAAMVSEAPPRPVPPVRRPAPKPAAVPKPVIPRPASSAAIAPASKGGNWRVQLGAFSQKAGATALFRKYSAGPLAGRQSYLVPAGAVTRLQAGPFASRADAAAACRALAAHGQACFPVGSGR